MTILVYIKVSTIFCNWNWIFFPIVRIIYPDSKGIFPKPIFFTPDGWEVSNWTHKMERYILLAVTTLLLLFFVMAWCKSLARSQESCRSRVLFLYSSYNLIYINCAYNMNEDIWNLLSNTCEDEISASYFHPTGLQVFCAICRKQSLVVRHTTQFNVSVSSFVVSSSLEVLRKRSEKPFAQISLHSLNRIL